MCLQYPTIAFLYFAGWLGWSGSKYLQAVKNDPKPIEKEIIIDVPLVSSTPSCTIFWLSSQFCGLQAR